MSIENVFAVALNKYSPPSYGNDLVNREIAPLASLPDFKFETELFVMDQRAPVDK